MTQEHQRVFNLKEAAAELNISKATLSREIRRGRITHRREGLRRIVFEPRHLEEYRERNTHPAKEA